MPEPDAQPGPPAPETPEGDDLWIDPAELPGVVVDPRAKWKLDQSDPKRSRRRMAVVITILMPTTFVLSVAMGLLRGAPS